MDTGERDRPRSTRGLLAILSVLAGPVVPPLEEKDDEAAYDEALNKMLKLECSGCGRTIDMMPTDALKSPVDGSWFGIVDAPERCGCSAHACWKYIR